MKYVRKAIEIEAVQFTRSNWEEVVKFTAGKAKNVTADRCPNGRYYCWLDTDIGLVKVSEGEYIWKDSFGMFGVYEQFAFESSFEPFKEGSNPEPEPEPDEGNKDDNEQEEEK